MNIWNSTHWKQYYAEKPLQSGIKLDFDKEVAPDVREAIKKLVRWLRRRYVFPVRVRVYIRKTVLIKARDGDMVYDLFFWPHNRDEYPYIKMGVGDYPDLLKRKGRDDALAPILLSLLHELTHYFQWLNDMELDEKKLDRQAEKMAREILNDYASENEHP